MKKENILADCTDELRSGWCTLDECIAKYPPLANELRTIALATELIRPEKTQPSLEFKAVARDRLTTLMSEANQTVGDHLAWNSLRRWMLSFR